jgi:hypothetical protein
MTCSRGQRLPAHHIRSVSNASQAKGRRHTWPGVGSRGCVRLAALRFSCLSCAASGPRRYSSSSLALALAHSSLPFRDPQLEMRSPLVFTPEQLLHPKV